MKIIDDFLPKEEFKNLQNFLLSDTFPWFYNSTVVHKEENVKKFIFQFAHVFYNHGIPNPYFDFVRPLLIALQPKPYVLMRLKANLTTHSEKIIEHGYHVDLPDSKNIISSAVFYINNNDGYTKFEDGTKVNSVENRLVIFKSNIKHTGTTCTDTKIRVVLNINYIECP